MSKNQPSTVLIMLFVLVAIYAASNYNLYSFKGESLCSSKSECLISPGDVILTKDAQASTVQTGDILCTDDDICHVLVSKSSEDFCTEGINVNSLNKCYNWEELESKVQLVITPTLLSVLFVASIVFVIRQ